MDIFSKSNLKRQILLFVSALPMLLVRNDIQYGNYVGVSIPSFLGVWFFYFLALLLVAMIANIIMNKFRSYFFVLHENKEISMELTIYHLAFFSIIFSASIFVLKNWPVYEVY